MYAGDPTLSTDLGQPAHSFSVSVPATYIVHRDSQLSAEAVAAYLKTVHELITEAAKDKNRVYFGQDLQSPLREWSAAEKATAFNPELALAALSTPEIAINPIALAHKLRECIAARPLIEVHCGRTVIDVKLDRLRICVHSEGKEGKAEDSFDCVVNALWDGRRKLNDAAGFSNSSLTALSLSGRRARRMGRLKFEMNTHLLSQEELSKILQQQKCGPK